jgi:hypothetical protein
MTATIPSDKTIEHCTAADIGIRITGEDAQPVIDALDEYLKVFAKPTTEGEANILFGNHKCLNCDKVLNGAMGSFQWGLCNGEGNCSGCGHPARAHHRPTDTEGEIFNGPLEYVLQYHPDFVTRTDDIDDTEGE